MSEARCPGYRNLQDVTFRDESERVVRKAHQVEQVGSALIQATLFTLQNSSPQNAIASKPKSRTPSSLTASISPLLSQPLNELGANFFFTKYILKEPPFTNNYYDWLIKSYFENGSNHALRATIEAVGMAGISNVYHAPRVAFRSKEKYCMALAAMKQALSDPILAIADTTFMAVGLLGLFEVSLCPILILYKRCSTTSRLSISKPGSAILLGQLMFEELWLC